MDKNIIVISVAILCIVSGATFAGYHSFPQEPSSVDRELNKNVKGGVGGAPETLSSQMFDQERQQQKRKQRHKDLTTAEEREVKVPSHHYLLRYRIRM